MFSLLGIAVFALLCSSRNANTHYIAFLSNDQASDREFDLIIYDRTTSEATNLTAALDNLVLRSTSRPRMNHQRSSVILIAYDPLRFVELNLDSRTVRDITAVQYKATDYILSPDGLSLVYTENPDSTVQLFKVDIETGHKFNLSQNNHNNMEACFSSDGKKIIYVCDEDGSQSIAIMNTNGSGQTLLTNAFADDRYPAISSDNRRIVFSSSRGAAHDGDSDLYMIDSDGENFELFHDSNAFDSKPMFVSNDKTVAFVSNKRGTLFRDIYFKDIQSGETTPITHELDFFCQNAVYAAKEQILLFENTSPAVSRIMLYNCADKRLSPLVNRSGRQLSPSL